MSCQHSVRFYYCILVCCLLAATGACSTKGQSVVSTPEPLAIKKMVVFGFSPALSPGTPPGVVRDPLSGSLFDAEPVPAEAVALMNEELFKRMLAIKGIEFISQGQTSGVYMSLINSGALVGKGNLEILQEVGRAFGADAVLAGFLYRWQEREGKDFAVSSPASVAFSLNLVNPANGELIWRDKFDKTQRPLSENVLDLDTFVKGKGRWMTVQSLAFLGLDDVLANFPISISR